MGGMTCSHSLIIPFPEDEKMKRVAAAVNLPTVRLRQWRQSDLEALVALNADPDVMEFFPRTLTPDESQAMLDRLHTGIADRGWGFWAVDVDGVCAGFTGLGVPTFKAHFTPCVEIGWRLHRAYWGKSIAYAAACQTLDYAAKTLGLSEVVSFTSVLNIRSQRLMQRLGLSTTPADDFLHPSLDESDRLRPHVLYRTSLTSPTPGGGR